MSRIRLTVLAGILTVLVTTMITVVSPTVASAATPLCTKARNVTSGGRAISMPATANNSLTCLIGRNSAANSTVVRHLQSTMKACYPTLRLADPYSDERISQLAVDGDFGPRTEAAMKAVQDATGADVDGVYGPNTRDRMRFRSNDVPTEYYRYVG